MDECPVAGILMYPTAARHPVQGSVAEQLIYFNRVVKNVMSDGLSRQIFPKKRSLWVINEHFEGEFYTLRSSAIVFQHPVNAGKRFE
jgi:hypothetical protein